MPTKLLPADTRDKLANSFRRIDTLTALLWALPERFPGEPLDGEVVGETARMISEETARLRDLLRPFVERK